MSEPKKSGKEAALQLAERIVISSLLSGAGQKIPPTIERILEFAPNNFTLPHAGEIALAIRNARDNGKAPDIIKVLLHLDGDSVDEAQRLAADPSGLPLDLADLESAPLLRRFQFQTLVSTLGEAWQEARENPEKAPTVGRVAIHAIERAITDIPDKSFPLIYKASDFVALNLEEPSEIIAGLLHQGTKAILGGGSKSFKTWVQLDAAISVAAGIPWMGMDTIASRVLYVNFEIQDVFFQDRVRVVSKARGIPVPDNLEILGLRGKSAPYDFILPKIIDRIKSSGYKLVIIDPIYKLYGDTDENSAGDVAKLLNMIEGVCVTTKAAVAFGAHYSKGNQAGKESIDRVSGSGVFARDPDTIVSFTKHEENGCFVIEPILRNLPPVDPFVVRWKFPLMLRDEDLDPGKLKQPSHIGKKKKYDPLEVLQFVSSRTKENPVSVSEWAEASGIKRQTLQEYISELREAGMIASLGEGSHVRKYVTEKGLKALSNSTAGN